MTLKEIKDLYRYLLVEQATAASNFHGLRWTGSVLYKGSPLCRDSIAVAWEPTTGEYELNPTDKPVYHIPCNWGWYWVFSWKTCNELSATDYILNSANRYLKRAWPKIEERLHMLRPKTNPANIITPGRRTT